MNILAIETSCDETAASIVQNGRTILSNAVASQIEMHTLYGGVVPELASRKHMETITPIVKQALQDANMTKSDLQAIAVTNTPGMIGALLVGVNFAKSLAYGWQLPLIPVHHVRGHIASNYLTHPDLKPPFLCLCVSGGTTALVDVEDYTKMTLLGSTRDDAVGECFDKVARVLGIGYPGGKPMDTLAQQGTPNTYPLPRSKVDDAPLDMSFSGLKTACLNLINKTNQQGEELHLPNFAASLGQAITDTLVPRTIQAAKLKHRTKIAIAGGVSANTLLRTELQTHCNKENISLYLPNLSLCGDNAAMIASQAYYEAQNTPPASLDLNAYATCSIQSIKK